MNKSFILAVAMAACSLTACGPSQKEKALQAKIEAEREEHIKDSVAEAEKEAARMAFVQDSIAKAKAEEIKAQAEQDAKAKAIIRKLFEIATCGSKINYDYRYLENHCTKKLLNKLSEDYKDYDENIFGYAIWDFRTWLQDGDLGHKTKIISITSLGDNWYRYDYFDCDSRCAKKIRFVNENGELKADQIVTLIEQKDV